LILYKYLRLHFPRLLKIIWCSLLLFILQGSILYGQSKMVSEYQVKAVFIFNFTQFVEWPQGTFHSREEPFIIGIFGENVFGNNLTETVAGEKYGTHPIIIKYHHKAEDSGKCHMLYINSGNQEEIKNILASLPEGVLTVSDMPDFNSMGGMIQFYTENNKIRLRINAQRSRSAGLTISSKLLSVAKTD
jgi:hypothetical protein